MDSKDSKTIVSYKGMDKNMQCRGFQFEAGKEYEIDGIISACDHGFHACERPMDVFSYYSPANSRYFEVEQSGDISRDGKDSKVASRKIKIGAEIGIPDLIKAHFEYVKKHTTSENTNPKLATAGFRGAATAGSYGAATAGFRGAATAGDSGVATVGDSGAAMAGFHGAATAGSYGAATAGSYGAATSRGSVSVGENGIACVRGNGIKAKGGIGAVLLIAVENEENYDLKEWKAVVVDGKKVKADTWYTLVDGDLIETE